MTTFFTSDHHFGHLNIIKYCDRPFKEVYEMNDTLVSLWNETVGVDDTVWVLGDFAMGKIDESLANASKLNGVKHLIVGNHDRMFSRDAIKSDLWEERYRMAGFATITHGHTTIDVDGIEVVLSHFPYGGDSLENDRFVQNRPVDSGLPLLHGHVHERWRQNNLMINVGVDAWAGRPVHVSEVKTLIEAGANNIDRIIWAH